MSVSHNGFLSFSESAAPQCCISFYFCCMLTCLLTSWYPQDFSCTLFYSFTGCFFCFVNLFMLIFHSAGAHCKLCDRLSNYKCCGALNLSLNLVQGLVYNAPLSVLHHCSTYMHRLSTKALSTVHYSIMHFLMKLFCTSNTDIVNDCRMYCGFKLPSVIIPTRTNKFMSKLSNAVNSC